MLSQVHLSSSPKTYGEFKQNDCTFSFSNLFAPSPKKPDPPVVAIRYNSPQVDGDKSTPQRSSSLDSGTPNSIGVASGGGFGSEK